MYFKLNLYFEIIYQIAFDTEFTWYTMVFSKPAGLILSLDEHYISHIQFDMTGLDPIFARFETETGNVLNSYTISDVRF